MTDTWILDTQPDEEPWGWRQRKATLPQSGSAADRFVILTPGDDPLPWPIPIERTHAPVARWSGSGAPSCGTGTTGRLLPMMGAGQTLSAGIAIGHYKTPLGTLLRAAWNERDRAKGKEPEGRESGSSTQGNAFSIRRFTRGGEKSRLQLEWGERGARPEEALAGYVRARRVIAAFRAGELQGRVPYKLREVEQAVIAAWSSEQTAMAPASGPDPVTRLRTFAEGLFVTEIGALNEVRGPAFELWWSGLRGALGIGAPTTPPTRDAGDPSRGLGSEQGLSVCRFLGALTGSEEAGR